MNTYYLLAQVLGESSTTMCDGHLIAVDARVLLIHSGIRRIMPGEFVAAVYIGRTDTGLPVARFEPTAIAA